jgi:urate oxidase
MPKLAGNRYEKGRVRVLKILRDGAMDRIKDQSNRETQRIQSGIRDLIILESSGSGFDGYPKDKYTTSTETSDRILGTSFSATWNFMKDPGDYRLALA